MIATRRSRESSRTGTVFHSVCSQRTRFCTAAEQCADRPVAAEHQDRLMPGQQVDDAARACAHANAATGAFVLVDDRNAVHDGDASNGQARHAVAETDAAKFAGVWPADHGAGRTAGRNPAVIVRGLTFSHFPWQRTRATIGSVSAASTPMIAAISLAVFAPPGVHPFGFALPSQPLRQTRRSPRIRQAPQFRRQAPRARLHALIHLYGELLANKAEHDPKEDAEAPSARRRRESSEKFHLTSPPRTCWKSP